MEIFMSMLLNMRDNYYQFLVFPEEVNILHEAQSFSLDVFHAGGRS